MITLLDISKEINSVDRNTLLTKIEMIGTKGMALKWFNSYLNWRQQFVSINGVESDSRGSIMALYKAVRLTVMININNIYRLNIWGRLFLVADDRVLISAAPCRTKYIGMLLRAWKMLKHCSTLTL